MKIKRYILSYNNKPDSFVAIDSSSGYPYEVELPRALFYINKYDAELFAAHFKDEFVVEKVILHLIDRDN